ncbi:ABC transporter ATP-binding protein [Xanthomonas axonopodis]|uniref:ABC transporter ATP-binding protein n=1 Tax=Xanthomonas axonopodis TaxID=53413 RepID=UPI00355907A2
MSTMIHPPRHGIRSARSDVLLRADGVTLQYPSGDSLVTATWRVSFDVHHMDRYILLGPSGCGKSSLLKAVGGFIHPTEGSIHLRGKAVQKPGPDRMMVFQEFDQLFPWRTVLENVMFPMTARSDWSTRDRHDRALASIDKVGLAKFAHSYPHQLSGGMKQRAAIARAMAMEPDVLLMDEPFAALDALTRRRLQDELLRLWEEVKFTMLFVTHGIDEATRVGSRILVLSPHPGQVRAELSCPDHWGADERKALEQQITEMLLESKESAHESQ